MAAPLRIRLAKALLGSKAKDFIPPLSMFDGWSTDGSNRLKNYRTGSEQLSANVGWVFAANSAIVEPCGAVKLKLYRKKKDGDREEITDHELLDLLAEPNFAHTGEQMRQLHFTYMNLVGSSYTLMLKNGKPFVPTKGQLPDAFQLLPAHQVTFVLGASYTTSMVKYGQEKYPITTVIRDLNPDPGDPYQGRSVITAAASTIDTEEQMKQWNRRFFANNARPSLVFSTKDGSAMDDEAYARWKAQFDDQHTGTENAFKPLLIEGGDVKNMMMSQTDLDFLNSRKFSKDEILAMFKVSPGILGMLEGVNRSSLDTFLYAHALFNIVPRMRQYVRQLQASLVSVYDPTLELDYENPVPEDLEAKLTQAQAGVNKWWTIDEVRDLYGDDPLPEGLGEQLYVPTNTVTLDTVADPAATASDDSDDPLDPDDDGDDPTGDVDATKSLTGVKKKT